jgi:hypothetical protein
MSATNPERIGDISQKVAEFEGELQDVVRKNVTYWRKPSENEVVSADGINAAIQRVAGASLDEIDHVIGQLESMRDTLRREGERVQHEISTYADLSQSAMASMKIIAEGLARWERPTRSLTDAARAVNATD